MSTNGHVTAQPTISQQAKDQVRAGLGGPVIDVCGENNEHRHVLWPMPGVRDAIVISFAEYKLVAAEVLKIDAQIELQVQQQQAASKILVPTLDTTKLGDIRQRGQ